MKYLLLLISFFSASAIANDSAFYGDILLRYENEQGHVEIKDRERLRAIIHAGLRQTLSDNWSYDIRLSSGLKNKQNVPAITLHRFNDQPKPDSDIFLERAYLKGKFKDTQVYLGKIPWKNKQVTDTFWDRHLSPYGAHIQHKLSARNALQFSYFKPLDGQSDTVGNMWIVQWDHSTELLGGKWRVSPWWVKYSGQGGAQYAKKDTALDNEFVRLSTQAKYGPYRFGMDLGYSLESFSQEQWQAFSDEKLSYAFEARYGGLKNTGQYLAQLRYLHVERFAVITEFAQNAVSRFATSDVKGWDFRVRRKMDKQWWLGMRFSDMQNIVADEKGTRFRIEAKYTF